ncbi:hypothetical protein SCNRRL3882_4010 [Streptomyces chartreusis NRRL 3882]|uniref:Uncharacterized protein n=1 Tax=Streptomyces chartreusis NRRL 3882 TaxID=1079985 RepID=A0A2N9BB29_STRCX|nr:hypothetical protein SCNRRL3882_4010 [Streptomyces chartreusis NRRL 3882]
MHDGWTGIVVGVISSVTFIVTLSLHAVSGIAERAAETVRALKTAKAEIQRPATDGDDTSDKAR